MSITTLVKYEHKSPTFLGEMMDIMDIKIPEDISFAEYIRFLSLRRRTILSIMLRAVDRQLENVVVMLTHKLYDTNDLLSQPMEAYYLLKHPEAEITYVEFLEKVVEQNKTRSNV